MIDSTANLDRFSRICSRAAECQHSSRMVETAITSSDSHD